MDIEYNNSYKYNSSYYEFEDKSKNKIKDKFEETNSEKNIECKICEKECFICKEFIDIKKDHYNYTDFLKAHLNFGLYICSKCCRNDEVVKIIKIHNVLFKENNIDKKYYGKKIINDDIDKNIRILRKKIMFGFTMNNINMNYQFNNCENDVKKDKDICEKKNKDNDSCCLCC
jgi:hypothetical protein